MELLENPPWKILILLAFDTLYKLYLYLIQTGRGVVGWEGKRSREGQRGGGVTTETLCVMDLLHTHPQAAAFAKDQATK